MHLFIDSRQKQPNLKMLNNCHMFLHAFYLSDIVDTNGSRIESRCWEVQHICHSDPNGPAHTNHQLMPSCCGSRHSPWPSISDAINPWADHLAPGYHKSNQADGTLLLPATYCGNARTKCGGAIAESQQTFKQKHFNSKVFWKPYSPGFNNNNNNSRIIIQVKNYVIRL